MGKFLGIIKKIISEDHMDPDFVVSMKDFATDDNLFRDSKKRLEKSIRLSGFGKSIEKINSIGAAKWIVYFSDDQEAKKAEKWLREKLKNTKVNIFYKDLSTNGFTAGIVLDFTRV